jgi:hypothetical protein
MERVSCPNLKCLMRRTRKLSFPSNSRLSSHIAKLSLMPFAAFMVCATVLLERSMKSEMSDYSHHIFQYLIWKCLRGNVVPAIRLEKVG